MVEVVRQAQVGPSGGRRQGLHAGGRLLLVGSHGLRAVVRKHGLCALLHVLLAGVPPLHYHG